MTNRVMVGRRVRSKGFNDDRDMIGEVTAEGMFGVEVTWPNGKKTLCGSYEVVDVDEPVKATDGVFVVNNAALREQIVNAVADRLKWSKANGGAETNVFGYRVQVQPYGESPSWILALSREGEIVFSIVGENPIALAVAGHRKAKELAGGGECAGGAGGGGSDSGGTVGGCAENDGDGTRVPRAGG